MTQSSAAADGDDVAFLKTLLPELQQAVENRDATRTGQLLNKMFLECSDSAALGQAWIEAFRAAGTLDDNPGPQPGR